MKLTPTKFKGLFIIEPNVFQDKRGYFFESYNKRDLKKLGIDYEFVQDNQSMSVYGVIRGLHYQLNPHAQTKLVRVILGKILDVVVDLRENSPTYGQYFSIILSDENKKQLLVPKGFAHGFSVLSEKAIVFYKTDNYYNKESERGILYNDPFLNIDWQIPENQKIISQKDNQNPLFSEAEKNFYL